MRDIKFRAWYEGVMYPYVEMTTYADGSNCCTMIGQNMDAFLSPDSDKIIPMEYIGFKDENKKDIFESDIVSAFISMAGFTIQGIIVLDKGCWSIKVHQNAETLPLYGCSNIRILGNIHENANLI